MNISLDIATLAAGYASGSSTVADVIAEVRKRIAAYPDRAVWIDLLEEEALAAQIANIQTKRSKGVSLPLFGIPFAVKDNVDAEGRRTTAACPDFAYLPERSATAVQKLCQAGAILIGKTNLDQFATGLVGTRSPYGACKNPFDARYISGGSSSGSAVAVSAGLVSFALGTDTAGSGRVPAAFCNLVGFKPTRGFISTAGVVPACRSLDCVSIFSLTANDAATVANIIRGFDPADAYSRRESDLPFKSLPEVSFRFGVPRANQLKFFGNAEYERLYGESQDRLEKMGGRKIEFDFAPFAEAASLLYQGPWVAERKADIATFVKTHPDSILPIIRQILSGADRFTATDAFLGEHRLAALKQSTRPTWDAVDLLCLPTTGTIYQQSDIETDPIQLNSNLGYYTNFVNLMDLCAVAIPAGFTTAGLPGGISLIAPAGCDLDLLQIGAKLHRSMGLTLGNTGAAMPDVIETAKKPNIVLLSVVGAHLSGQPLNAQLTSRGAKLIRSCKTSPHYRLYALANTTPAKPGLVWVEGEPAYAIEVEVWELSLEAFGSFVADVPPPMAIGTTQLEDGTSVKGFVCEPFAVKAATDISHFGGWRAYLKSGR